MSRTHGRIGVGIWSDPDWLSLPMHAQWLYMALVSQEGINHAGLIDLTPRRWARLCANRDADLVADALKYLSKERFVVLDDDDERLLVRTFIRNDKVADQPNTLKNACVSVRLVTSAKLRTELLAELRKLDQDRIAAMNTTRGHESAISVLRATIEALSSSPDPEPEPHGVTPSDGYPDGFPGDPIVDPIPRDPIGDPLPRTRAGEGEGEGEVVTSCSKDETPPLATLADPPAPSGTPPESVTATASNADNEESGDLPDPFDAFWAAYPRRTDKRAAEKAWRAALKRGVDPAAVITAARAYTAANADTEPRFVKHPATWLNAGAYDNPAESPRAVAGGYQGWTNPPDPSVYDEPLIDPSPREDQ